MARERERFGGYSSSSALPTSLPGVDSGPAAGARVVRQREYTVAGQDRDGKWIAVLDQSTLVEAREYARKYGGTVVTREVTDWEPLDPESSRGG